MLLKWFAVVPSRLLFFVSMCGEHVKRTQYFVKYTLPVVRNVELPPVHIANASALQTPPKPSETLHCA